MNLNIAQKFLIFRDTTISRLKAQGEINETTLIYIKDLEQKINILDTRIDQLENNMQEMGQAIVESIAPDPPDVPF
tara:strand:- start:67 stop:294 length:228 start_codon:yes stop_codon:yes gene_type:complete